jgi:hypothetical protein
MKVRGEGLRDEWSGKRGGKSSGGMRRQKIVAFDKR